MDLIKLKSFCTAKETIKKKKKKKKKRKDNPETWRKYLQKMLSTMN